MFRESNPLFRFAANMVIAMILVMGMANLGGYFYEADKSEFIVMDEIPTIQSAKDWKPAYKFHPGEAILIENKATKHEIGCYADYQFTMTGPVSYSVQIGKSRNIMPRGTTHKFVMKSFLPIPHTLPTGVYQIQLIVFPICDGIPRDPFNIYQGAQPWIQVYGDPVK